MAKTIQSFDGYELITTDSDSTPVTSLSGDAGDMIQKNFKLIRDRFGSATATSISTDAKAAQLVIDQAAVTAAAPSLYDSETVIGVTGTLGASTLSLLNLGTHGIGGVAAKESNIGAVILDNCFAGAFASDLDLSDNRMDATAIATLIDAIYLEINTNGSNATVVLDISGNAVPNAATMEKIYELCTTDGCVITIELPGTVSGTESGADVPAQDYTYVTDEGLWIGSVDSTDQLYVSGGHWVIWSNPLLWTSTGDMAGTYELAAHEDIIITIA